MATRQSRYHGAFSPVGAVASRNVFRSVMTLEKFSKVARRPRSGVPRASPHPNPATPRDPGVPG